MDKQLFVAPAGHGKTAYALKMAQEQAKSLEHEVRVCVPGALQARVWRARLAQGGGAIGIHIWTFDELVANCLLETGRAYHEISDAVQNRLLRLLFEDVELKYYAALRDKAGFIEVSKRLIGELKAGSIDPQPLKTAVNEMGAGPRLVELVEIYNAYQEAMIDHNWADRAGLHWLAAEAIKSYSDNPFGSWPLLIIDGFDDLPPSQLALLTLLADRVQKFVITLTNPGQGRYPRYEQFIEEVENCLKVKSRFLPEGANLTGGNSLYQLARMIFSVGSNNGITNDGALRMIEVSERSVEARSALRWLKQRLVWDGYAPGDLALLARDITPYKAYISEIAAEFGLPVRLLDGHPLIQNPAAAALLDLLRLYLPGNDGQEAALPRRGVIEAWRSPYFSWRLDDLAISAADAEDLDILSRQQRVIGGLDQWQAAFEAGKGAAKQAGIDEDEDDSAVLSIERVLDLRAKFNLFLEISDPGRQLRTVRQFVTWLIRLLGPEAEDDAIRTTETKSLFIFAMAKEGTETYLTDTAALRRLVSLLDEFVYADEAVGRSRKLPFHKFFSEFSAAIGSASFTMANGAKKSEILVASLAQVRGVIFRGIALMGLSEGSFPQSVKEDPFLRDSDRELLRKKYQLPLQPSAQSAEQIYFYEAISRAREKLLLTRPVIADNGALWVASPYWEAVLQVIDCPVERVSGDAVLPLAQTASWAEWWESAVALGAGSSLAKDRDPQIESRIEHAARIWRNRKLNSDSIWNGDLSVVGNYLAEQYDAQHVWSASRLEAFKSCGFLFFVQNVLQLSGRGEPAEGLDAGQLGRLYHDILEQVMNQAQGIAIDETAVVDFIRAVAEPILENGPQKYGFRVTPWWQQTKAEILANVCSSVLSLADEQFEFFTAEASFGFEGSPLIIENGDDALRLHGFIDRVDRRADGALRIVDYKTSGKWAFSKRDFEDGKKLQLPLYALAAQEALQLGPVVDGFYWHLQHGEPSPFQLGKGDGGVEGAIETAVYHAWEAVHAVRAGQFMPVPPTNGCPNFCPAAGFCVQYAPKNF